MQQQLLDVMLGTVKGIHDRLSARIDRLEQRETPVPAAGRDGRDGLEGRPGPPGPPGPALDVGPLLDRLLTLQRDHEALLRVVEDLQARLEAREAAVADMHTASALRQALDAHASRLEKLEELPRMAGPAGPPGPKGLDGKDGAPGRDGKDGRDGLQGEKGLDGTNGRDGRDGVDGLGFDDLDAEFDVETKRLILRLIRDGRIKEWSWFLPFVKYRGVFDASQSYLEADQVTHAGSMWVALEATSQTPGEYGEGAKAWILSAKRGKDGKPGPPGPKGLDGKDGRPGKDLTQLGPDGAKW